MRTRIKELRARHDLTQAEMARIVGVRRETIVFLARARSGEQRQSPPF